VQTISLFWVLTTSLAEMEIGNTLGQFNAL